MLSKSLIFAGIGILATGGSMYSGIIDIWSQNFSSPNLKVISDQQFSNHWRAANEKYIKSKNLYLEYKNYDSQELNSQYLDCANEEAECESKRHTLESDVAELKEKKKVAQARREDVHRDFYSRAAYAENWIEETRKLNSNLHVFQQDEEFWTVYQEHQRNSDLIQQINALQKEVKEITEKNNSKIDEIKKLVDSQIQDAKSQQCYDMTIDSCNLDDLNPELLTEKQINQKIQTLSNEIENVVDRDTHNMQILNYLNSQTESKVQLLEYLKQKHEIAELVYEKRMEEYESEIKILQWLQSTQSQQHEELTALEANLKEKEKTLSELNKKDHEQLANSKKMVALLKQYIEQRSKQIQELQNEVKVTSNKDEIWEWLCLVQDNLEKHYREVRLYSSYVEDNAKQLGQYARDKRAWTAILNLPSKQQKLAQLEQQLNSVIFGV